MAYLRLLLLAATALLRRATASGPSTAPMLAPATTLPFAPPPTGARNLTEKPTTAEPDVLGGSPSEGARNLAPDARNCPVASQCSFVERFSARGDRWIAAHGYANGVPFDAWWSKSKAVIDLANKVLRLGVAKSQKFGKGYVGGQLQTTRWHGYGCYEVRMKPVNQQGLISTFFTYTGKWDAAPGAKKRHNEVDIEFVWKKFAGKLMMQCNYFTNGRGGNEHYVGLPFNPALAFHNYAFRWTSKKIDWFADGKKVYTAYNNIPKLADGPHKIMMNFWPVSAQAGGWGGWYTYQGPRTVLYDTVRFTKGENCQIMNKF